MKKDTQILLALVIVVVVIIAAIMLLKNKNSETLEEKTARCIAAKSIMYSQLGCSHCVDQKKILGNYTSLFNIIECNNNPRNCSDAGITGTPTWVINGQKIEGTQTIEKLKELTGC